MAKYTLGLMVGLLGATGIWMPVYYQNPAGLVLTVGAILATIIVSISHWEK